MQKLKFNYKIRKATAGSGYFFVQNGAYKYIMMKGIKSGTWYVREAHTGEALACANTLRDGVIKCLLLENSL